MEATSRRPSRSRPERLFLPFRQRRPFLIKTFLLVVLHPRLSIVPSLVLPISMLIHKVHTRKVRNLLPMEHLLDVIKRALLVREVAAKGPRRLRLIPSSTINLNRVPGTSYFFCQFHVFFVDFLSVCKRRPSSLTYHKPLTRFKLVNPSSRQPLLL